LCGRAVLIDRLRLGEIGDPTKNCEFALDGAKVGREVGREQILGIDTIKLETINNTSAVGYQWRAPALGCEVLRRFRLFRKDGVDHDISDRVAMRIIPGEPDASYFQIPADYHEMAPQQLAMARYKQEFNRDTPAETARKWQNWEALYARHKFDPRMKYPASANRSHNAQCVT